MTREELIKIQETQRAKAPRNWVRIGYSSCGIAAGAKEVFDLLKTEFRRRGHEIAVRRCGCVGMCYAEPLVEILVEGMPRVFYGKVDKDTALRIIEEHVENRRLLADHVYDIPINRVSGE